MKRTGVLLAVILLALGTRARAGELDNEYDAKAKATPATPSAIAPASTGSELDQEAPTQAWFYGPRRGFGYGGFGYRRFGYGFGFGYPRFGYGFGFGYPRFGFGYGRGFGGFYGRGFYGRGFGGYGFRRGRW